MSRVLKVAGTKCREIFLATFATLSTVFCNFCFFRDIWYPQLFLLATFSLLIEKCSRLWFFSKILKLFFLTTVNTRDFNIYPGLYKNLFTLGGGIWPPRQKIPRTCQVGLKRGRVSKGGLNITFNPKKSNPRSSGCLRHNLKMSRQTALRRDFARIL